jgi:hypothetical protein
MNEINTLKKLDWECVGEYTKRLKIHGGWLVLYERNNFYERISGHDIYMHHPAITFVPDVNHEWVNEEYKL